MLNRHVVVGWVLKEKLKEVVSHEELHEKAPNKYYKLIKSYRNFNYRITKIILLGGAESPLKIATQDLSEYGVIEDLMMFGNDVTFSLYHLFINSAFKSI